MTKRYLEDLERKFSELDDGEAKLHIAKPLSGFVFRASSLEGRFVILGAGQGRRLFRFASSEEGCNYPPNPLLA